MMPLSSGTGTGTGYGTLYGGYPTVTGGGNGGAAGGNPLQTGYSYTPPVNPYAGATYGYTPPQASVGTGYYANYAAMTPEQQQTYLEYWNSVGLPGQELSVNTQLANDEAARQSAQFGATFGQTQYTDQEAINLANRQQGFTEYWQPQEQANQLAWYRDEQGNQIAANAALQNQMVGWYGTEQQNDIANQQALQAGQLGWYDTEQQRNLASQASLQNQMVNWYGTEQQNQLQSNRELQANQLKSDAENAALGAWGRRQRPNARYL